MEVSTLSLALVVNRFAVFLGDIKFSHSIFALPFVVSALVLELKLWPRLDQLLFILLSMIFARSFAMGMNRIIDHKIDLQNSRTASRAIPAGKIKISIYIWITLSCGLLFVLSAFYLNNLAGVLAIPLLVVLASYGLFKRYSYFVHWYLGFCLGLAPIAAIIALGGEPSPSIYLLCIAIMVWTAAFDILYAMQDIEFDRMRGLYSIPALVGAKAARSISFFSFLCMLSLLVAVGLLLSLGWIYFLGMSVMGCLFLTMFYFLRDLEDSGKSRHINKVFFDINAYVGVVYMIAVIFDALYRNS